MQVSPTPRNRMPKRKTTKRSPKGARRPTLLPSDWPAFARRLGKVLATLPADHRLIVSVDTRQRFVQFASGDEDDRLTVECVGDHYLRADDQLTPAQRGALRRLGWGRPTRENDDDSQPGSPNWRREFDRPLDRAAIAALSVRTFREVYEVTRPEDLRYKAFTMEGKNVELPELGLEMETPPEAAPDGEDPAESALAPRVQDALQHAADEGVVARQGRELFLAISGVVLNVVVSDSPPIARFLATIEEDVEESDENFQRVNHVNAHHLQFGYTYLRDEDIRYAVELLLEPWSGPIVAMTARAAAMGVRQLREGEMGVGHDHRDGAPVRQPSAGSVHQ